MSAKANLTLEIGGRRFAVACSPGEETHIQSLGRMIDSRVREAGAVGQSEPRMLLFAALLLADELSEARGGEDPQLAAERTARREGDLAGRIDAVTQRIENLARHLEGGDRHA